MAKGMVTLEADRCKGCGLCVEVCPAFILKLSEEDFNIKGYRPIEVTDMSKCTGCRICAIICPDVVFSVYRQKRQKKAKAAATEATS